MTHLLIARESAENIAELIEAHSLSSHMKAIAYGIRTIVEEAGELGYVNIIPIPSGSSPCACGCGRPVISTPGKKKRIYYSSYCRQKAHKRRIYEKAVDRHGVRREGRRPAGDA